MAVATLKGPLSDECISKRTMEGNYSGKRRVFVQIETGFVFGIELDGSDNAHTLKRRLQVALNLPTEETLLICGDMVLKNDLSTVRNHSPLLLTKNCLHRSSSTPCLSPCAKDVEQIQCGPIEVIGCSTHFSGTRQLVKDIVKAMKDGINPVPVCSGLGGAYYFKDCNGENVAIIKPTDEEPFAPNNPKGFVGKALGQPGLKRSVRVGETGFREVAAYLLDYDGFANVPLTALVKVTHSIFNVNNDVVNGINQQQREPISKMASFQQFIPHECDASDHGTSSFPIAAVHRIGILDIRILNTDRHAGNLLVTKLDGVGKFDQVDLVPIDHGLCLPESLEDPYFEWMHWPQSSIPFSEDELEYIAKLDPFYDSDMLRMELPMIREACLRVLIICTIFLKAAATNGLCLAEIGEMMSREFRSHAEEPSELELICIEAKSQLLETKTIHFCENEEDEFQFDLEYEDYHELESPINLEDKPTIQKYYHGKINGSNGEKSWRHPGPIVKGAYTPSGVSPGNRSVSEHLPASSSFVAPGDMDEEEWLAFLDNFQRLLYLTFMNRKTGMAGQGLRQRLGTSCKF